MMIKIKKILGYARQSYECWRLRSGYSKVKSLDHFLQDYGTDEKYRWAWQVFVDPSNKEDLQKALRCAVKYRAEQLAYWCLQSGANAFVMEPYKDDQNRYLHLRPFEAFLIFGWGQCVKRVIQTQLTHPLSYYEGQWKEHYEQTVRILTERLDMGNYAYLALYGKSTFVWYCLEQEGSIKMDRGEQEALLLYALRIGVSRGLMYKLIRNWDPMWIEKIKERIRNKNCHWIWYQEPVTELWLHERLEYWRKILILKQKRQLEKALLDSVKDSVERKAGAVRFL